MLRNSRITQTSRGSEFRPAGGVKRVSMAESQPPIKQIGVRSPRCLGPSSPFAYLKDPDYMNMLPLDGKSAKTCMIPVQNSSYNKKRRNLDSTLEEITRDLENITILFQEITPQAPIKIADDENIPKATSLQILQSILEWLKAASFDLSLAKVALEDKDLDDSNEAVQSMLNNSIRSIEKLRTIHSKLMTKFNTYFKTNRYRTSIAAASAAGKLDLTDESLRGSKTDSGLNYRTLSSDVVELLQKERARTAETYEAKLKTLNATLAGQVTLIQRLTENLKNKGPIDGSKDRDVAFHTEIDSKTGAETDAHAKKTAKQKKKRHDAEDQEEGSSASRVAGDGSATKEMSGLQKTLQTCQTDANRLLQQNRLLIEAKKELTTANAHKDKVIVELRAKLLNTELSDKPKLDKLVVTAPKPTRAESPAQEKPDKPTGSRFIYVDSADRSDRSPTADSSASQEPQTPSMMEILLAQRKEAAARLFGGFYDDKADAAGQVKRSGDAVGDAESLDKDGKPKKRFSGDVDNEGGEMVGGDGSKAAGKTAGGADRSEKQTGGREGEKTAGDRSAATSAGGRAASGSDAAQGTADGKGKDRGKGKDGGASEAGGVDAGATRDKAGASGLGGHERELKGAEDRGVGKAGREGARSGGSSASGQEGREGADIPADQKGSKRLLSAGGSSGRRSDGSADQSGDVRDAKRSGRAGGKTSLTDTSGQRRFSAGTAGQDRADMMMVGGTGGKLTTGTQKESDRQRKGSAPGRERGPGGGQPSERERDQSPSLERDQHGNIRYGTQEQEFGAGPDGVGGKSSAFGAVGSKGMPGGQNQMFGGVGSMGMPGGQNQMFGGYGSMPGGQNQMFGGVGSMGMPGGQNQMFGGVGSMGMPGGQNQMFGAYGSMPGGQNQMFGGYGSMPGGQNQMFGGVGSMGMHGGQNQMFGAYGSMPGGQNQMFGGYGSMPGGQNQMFGVGSMGMPEGQSQMFGGVGSMPEGLPAGRPGSAGQQASGLDAFTPHQMSQRLAWLACGKEGAVPFMEGALPGLQVIGETAVHGERPCTEKLQGLTGAFPAIDPLSGAAGMASVLRSYQVDLNDPNTFAQQLEFIKHSGTMDGLRQAIKLLAPHLKLLEDNEEQGEHVLMDVMRDLQRRHAEMITEEFQPSTCRIETKQRRLMTFVTDRKQDICIERARQRSLLTQMGQARGLVHLKPLMGHDSNALSPCAPYPPAGYMDALPQKMMRDMFPPQRQRRLVTSAVGTKPTPGDVVEGLTTGNLLKTIDQLTKCGETASG